MLRESWGGMKPPGWSGAGRCTRDGPTDNMREPTGHGGPVGMGQAPGEDKAAPHWDLFGLRFMGKNKVCFLFPCGFYRASPGPQEAAEGTCRSPTPHPQPSTHLQSCQKGCFQPSNALPVGTGSHTWAVDQDAPHEAPKLMCPFHPYCIFHSHSSPQVINPWQQLALRPWRLPT